jgi:hypothetical protein
VPLTRPATNPHLTDEQRRFEGEKSVFIQCTWNVIAPSAMLSAPPADDRHEKWNRELALIVGATATAASVDEATLTLQIEFDNKVALRADPRDSPPEREAYTIRVEQRYWAVFADGRVEEENA